jgi:murein DD-endopeptidase MepM/ murein hydrolase activator NlpD
MRTRGWMQRRTAGAVATLGLLAIPQAAPALVVEGPPARKRIEPLNAISRALPAPAPPEHAFPVHGHHDFGTAVNGFGGGRGHQGQDIFARCKTPVVAAGAGRIVEVATEGAEGNYVVLETAPGRQQAYLHLLHPRSVSRGDEVGAGDRIGSVGQTGNAQGCHLHFELWTGPGRFKGGRPVDPRPALDRWATGG